MDWKNVLIFWWVVSGGVAGILGMVWLAAWIADTPQYGRLKVPIIISFIIFLITGSLAVGIR